jgi:glycosyltransferase involved in cell wall biosynthesis
VPETPQNERAISVVIPTYNRAHQIGGAIESVLLQTHNAHEIIVVDDGSKDETAAACRRFGSAVRYVLQPNAGVSAARNHGASLATGDLLAFLDSDDIWHPEKLALQVAALEACPTAGWSITDCFVIDANGEILHGSGWTAVFSIIQELGVSARAFFEQYFEPRILAPEDRSFHAFVGDAWTPLFLGNFALPSSAMIRRSLFEKSGGFDETFRLAEETEFFHRIAAAAPVVIIMEPLVGYRAATSGSLTSPLNTSKLIHNALASIDRASKLRAQKSSMADRNYRQGRQALLKKRAYAELSMHNRAGARAAIREAWQAGAPKGIWSLAVYALSLCPVTLLDALHRLKRGLG